MAYGPASVHRPGDTSHSLGGPEYMKAPFLYLGARKGAFMYSSEC